MRRVFRSHLQFLSGHIRIANNAKDPHHRIANNAKDACCVLLSKQQQSCRELFLVSSQDCSPKKVTKEITTTNTTKMFDKKLLYNVLLWLK